MDKLTKSIMELLKAKYKDVSGSRQYESNTGAREYHLLNLDDNLYLPMSVGAKASYLKGSGNELETKMRALRSSSAMTYNLFWDQIAEIVKENDTFGKGVYQVELEKQFHTLNPSVSKMPANLDAFLYCKHTKEAIACEMKMTEWLSKPSGVLKEAYLKQENYISNEKNPNAGKVFVDVAKQLIVQQCHNSKGYSGISEQYDALQMYKHAVACYTACVSEEPRKIRKLTLVNCVWELPCYDKLTPDQRIAYLSKAECEIDEFKRFKKVMDPINKVFSKIGVDFNICFYSFKDFLDLFNKTPEELEYLKRYTMN